MYPIYQNNFYNTQSIMSTKAQALPANVNNTSSPIRAQVPEFSNKKAPVFGTTTFPTTGYRTTLTTKDEQTKYTQIVSLLDKREKQNIDVLLRNGILLNNNSNDKSSVLDNLYKIASTQRADGLNTKVVLNEVINTVANPFGITQKFGDIPKPYKIQILQQGKPNPKTGENNQINPKSIEVTNSSDCVSASIEFNLAKQTPAEFARFAEALTSPKMAVEKTIQLSNLTDNEKDSIDLLKAFEVPHEIDDVNKTAKLTLTPDKNATIRAQIQTVDKDKQERSCVDVLMQSTFMNIGSQGAYDSLTDLRGIGKFNNVDPTGLIEFEKTFTESIVQDKNKISVTYQNLDDNAKLVGYNTDFATIKKNLLDSIAIGENVIIGYTELDKTNKVIGGHEITIIGSRQDKDGNTIFICNDTDDDNPKPIEYSADYIIPKIHHAGLPQQIVEPKTV